MRTTKETLYGVLAPYYDKIYHWKDYPAEVRKIRKLIRRYKQSPGNSLLDVACGTGKHLSYLRRDFNCVGVDLSEEMLAVARKNVPGVTFEKGNMINFDLRKRFDIVLCLFSSIGYLRTRKEVKKAFSNFANHMKKGGVLILEPWIRKSEWRDKTVHMQTFDSDSLKIARVNFGRADGAFSVLEEGFLVGDAGKGVFYFRDHSKMRFFEPEHVLKALKDAGLEPEFTEEGLMPGRGLIIAVRQ
jgi:ubiquinone/menaquinone biosynthesis C-methylase UbiE